MRWLHGVAEARGFGEMWRIGSMMVGGLRGGFELLIHQLAGGDADRLGVVLHDVEEHLCVVEIGIDPLHVHMEL